MKSKRNGRPSHRFIEPLEGRTLLSAALAQQAIEHPGFRLAHHAGLAPAATAAPTGLTPAQIRRAYGLDQISFGGVAGDGSGQTIAIVDAYDDPTAASDLHNFDAAFGLKDPSFTKLNEDGGTALPTTDTLDAKPNTWEFEESLDIEWAHVVAPAASLILYEANSASFTDLVVHGVNTARNNPSVTAISMSFAGGEFAGESSYDSYFTTPAGHAGISFFASTGDSGSPGGYPAYSPNVVAVGGTTLSVDSAGNYLSESAWSGSGGGISTQEPQPAYQNSVQSTGSRMTPDVSMDADPNSGVPVYDSFDNGTSSPWLQAGGTSLASPMWAGVVSVANQGRARNGLSSLDGPTQLLPMLYNAPSSDFHDITSGNNGGFAAGAGYDAVTGRGSPVANLLVPALSGTPSTTASFVRADTTTQGSWNGVYGADGYSVIGGSTQLPSYAQVSVSGHGNWTWAASTTQTRAPQVAAGSANRASACYFSANSFSFDVNLTGGQHQVELYMVDWDTTSRVQTVTVSNASSGAVLDSRTVSNFHSSGQWLVWNLSGHVTITLTNAGGINSVASALLFGQGGPITAGYVTTDAVTSGTWTGAYGGDGYDLFDSTAALPSYATVTPSSASTYVWAGSTTQTRGLQTAPGSSSRVAACYFSASSFTLDINLTDGKAHQVALYMIDWDTTTRNQTVRVTNATTGAVIDGPRTVSNFSNGQWLVWNLSGHVTITITNAGGINAVASGLMFAPAM